MAMQAALKLLFDRVDLSRQQMRAAMQSLMQGEATAAQIGAFLTALRMKGESVTEIAEAARVMREFAEPVALDPESIIDIVGTGGDGASIFNVSTASCFVVAASGARVAKHGNRSVSSKSGAADVLEASGARLDLTSAQIAQCVNECGLGFMFAPRHHLATKNVVGVRRELGVRTMFNLLGPLTNPAQAKRMVLGVFAKQWVRPLCEVMRELGAVQVLVVCAEDGLDEFSIVGTTHVAQLCDGEISEYSIDPNQFGFAGYNLQDIKVHDANASLDLILAAFEDLARHTSAHRAARAMIAFNAGAALFVAGQVKNISEGIAYANQLMQSGQARAKLDQFVKLTQRLADQNV